MNGIEILSSTTIYNTILPEECFIFTFVCACTFAVITIQLFIDGYDIAQWISLAAALAFAIATLLSVIPNKNNIDYIKYKITIDDSVSMNEFLDKYEILDQEGRIYTVKERE